LLCNKPGRKIALVMTVKGKRTSFDVVRRSQIDTTEGTMLAGGDCRCPVCKQTTPVENVRRAGLDGKMGERMLAVIMAAPKGKEYRPVGPDDDALFHKASKLAIDVERPGEYIVPEI